MKVLKFGGTSMGSSESFKAVAKIIQYNVDGNIDQVVICSAMSQVTNQLLAIGKTATAGQTEAALELFKCIKEKHFIVAKDLGVLDEFERKTEGLMKNLRNFITGISMIHELSDRSLAYLSSYGERFSSHLLVCVLQAQGLKAVQVDSDFIRTRGDNFLEDEVDWNDTKNEGKPLLKDMLKANKIPIVTGFFGTNKEEVVSLLGRGGSDYSAAIIGVILGCKTVEIWTDVDGFLSADPRIVKNAKVLEEIGFREASELCFFGAKVLHPRTIRPIIDMKGSVWIKNTFNRKAPGTRIIAEAKAGTKPVLSLSSKKVALLSLDLFASNERKRRSDIFYELFSAIKNHKVEVEAIAASEAMISFCIEERFLENKALMTEIEKVAPLDIRRGRSILCIVSPEKTVHTHGILAQIFASIADSGASVEMDSENASEVAQLIVIKNEDVSKVIQIIHKNLIE